MAGSCLTPTLLFLGSIFFVALSHGSLVADKASVSGDILVSVSAQPLGSDTDLSQPVYEFDTDVPGRCARVSARGCGELTSQYADHTCTKQYMAGPEVRCKFLSVDISYLMRRRLMATALDGASCKVQPDMTGPWNPCDSNATFNGTVFCCTGDYIGCCSGTNNSCCANNPQTTACSYTGGCK